MKDTLSKRFVEIYGKTPEVFAQAPGRVEFIGNHTDYNGGVVMGVAIDKIVMVALAKRSDKKFVFAKAKTGEKIEVSEIAPLDRSKNWVNYPLGVLKFLMEAGLKADFGFEMLDMSSLPAGAGLSSSAAIEMSSAMAFCKLYGFDADLKTMARAGRKSENLFVGMPCGILDQGVSAFGKKDALVFIDCMTEDFSNFPLSPDCKIWLFNSSKKHALVDGLYAERHEECMKASKILSGNGEAKLLRNFSLEDLESAKSSMDDVVYRRAKHVISENDRVLKTRDLLLKGDMEGVGKMLKASHDSSRYLFENSCEELDFLVEAACSQNGVYGARLSGGGFGGAIMALTDSSFGEKEASAICEAYEKKFGVKPAVITCSASDGAKAI